MKKDRFQENYTLFVIKKIKFIISLNKINNKVDLEVELDLIDYIRRKYGMIYDITFINSGKEWYDTKNGTRDYYTSALIEMGEDSAAKLVEDKEIRMSNFGIRKRSVRLKVAWSNKTIDDRRRQGSKMYLREIEALIRPD